MNSRKIIIKKRLKKSYYFSLVTVLLIGWVLAGWPQILGFPPGILKARVAAKVIYLTSGSSNDHARIANIKIPYVSKW